jgi:DDE domain
VSHETVRHWVNHLGPIIAAELRKRRPKPHSIWHLDEVYLKMYGRMAFRGCAVDAEGEVLDALVQSKRDERVAIKLMRRLGIIQRRDARSGDRRPPKLASAHVASGGKLRHFKSVLSAKASVAPRCSLQHFQRQIEKNGRPE